MIPILSLYIIPGKKRFKFVLAVARARERASCMERLLRRLGGRQVRGGRSHAAVADICPLAS